jgi:hypothetical protein
MLSSKVRNTIALLAVTGSVVAATGSAHAVAPRGSAAAAGAALAPSKGAVATGGSTSSASPRYVNGTGSSTCQAATDAANSWQAAGTKADLNGDYEEATKDYNNADAIAGQANAGPNGCVIYEPEA